MLELPEVSWGWQETCCGPFHGASTSLPGHFPVWCRRGHVVSLVDVCSPHPEVSPSFGGPQAQGSTARMGTESWANLAVVKSGKAGLFWLQGGSAALRRGDNKVPLI